ncbi:response regulator [Aliidiomarina soli]|uniref:Sensory/regulatory protein RpfC n=1 Tax=Aliidiomarina soli TaxID=1928574 RepID=A0A432WH77_9GAMM|nr:response regulator [Aliidiomarina soli]RUO33081.1 hybrid sensor histidine kinase/response regulator [Aliidiomarina soli]
MKVLFKPSQLNVLQHHFWWICTLLVLSIIVLPGIWITIPSALLVALATAISIDNQQSRQSKTISADSSQVLRQVFNDLPNRVYWRNTELKLIGANRAFLDDFGLNDLNEEDFAQQEFDALAANKELFQRDQATLQGQQACSSEELKLKLGEAADQTRWVEHASAPLYNDHNELIGVLGSYYDISTIKAATVEMAAAKEAAEQANQSKSDFLANMSHEIRTPINAIVGMANLALKTELNPKQQRYLKVINSSSNALLGVINDILDFSKIEANKLTIEHIPFDLDEVLSTLADMFAYKAYDKDLEFIINLPANIPTMLIGDPMRLNQVLVNLVSNAIKFTDEGEINVSCTLLEQSDDKVWLRMSVTDTGIGMDEEQRANLFQAFTQADTSTTRKFGGTGLGLTISQRLIKLMNGDLGVISATGQGSTFYVEIALPLQPNQDASHHQLLLERLEGVRILAIDDNLSTREMLYELLRSYKMDAKVARSAEQGLQIMLDAETAGTPYQIVLIDWRLPGMDGLTLVETMQQKLAAETMPKAILATGYYAEELAEKAKLVGACDFITKPYTTATLARVLNTAVYGNSNTDYANASDTIAHPASSERVPVALRNAPLLVVEDNEINQHVAKELLRGHGFSVDIAENGEVAVNMVQRKAYALVLMDIQMPVMDGYRAAETIRQNYSYQQLPIVAMTANAMSGDAERSLAAGMQGHIPKPIDEDMLLSQISKWAIPGPYDSSKPDDDGVRETPPLQQHKYPQVKGIEFASALARLNHNAALYIRLVKQLVDSYQQSAMKVAEFITRGKHDEARRYFHSLKGASANLGLIALEKKAGRLEDAMKGGDIATVADLIGGLDKLLNEAEQAADDFAALHQSQQNSDTGATG